LQIIKLKKGENYIYNNKFQAYMFKGSVIVSGKVLKDGDLFEDKNLNIKALQETHFFLISLN
jgi:ribosomal protein L18E